MSRNHLVAIVIGVVLLAILWLFVVPLLLDLGDKSSKDASLGWIVLVGATIIVGWVMFRPPGHQPDIDGPRPRRRRGLRRSRDERRRRDR